MAEIPDINPVKPIWPTRPDERGHGQRDREQEEGEREKQEPEPAPPKRKPDPDDGHQIDEYV